MNWQDLLLALKESTSTENFDNIPDEKYYKWLSWSHNEISEYLKSQIDSKFFMWISQADLVAWQNLYDNLWKDETTWLYINVIDSIFVKYNWTDFIKVRIDDFTEKDKSREYLEEHQPTTDPFATIIDWQKILLFPTPKVDATNGIEVTWSRNVKEITDSTTEQEIFNWVLKEWHYLIVKWAEQYVYKYLQELWKAQNSRNEFKYQDLPKLKAELSYRWSQPLEYKETNLNYLT